MPSPRQRLRHDQFGHPARPVQHLHHRANLAAELIGHRVVGFVHDEHVGDLHDAGFEHLNRVAAARLQRDERRLRELGDFDLALSDADRFDQHDVEAERVHQQHRVGGRAGKAAEMSAAGHRANEDVAIGEMLGKADAIAEQRAVRERRARIDRDDADASCRSERALRTSPEESVDFPTPGGPVKPTVIARPVFE